MTLNERVRHKCWRWESDKCSTWWTENSLIQKTSNLSWSNWGSLVKDMAFRICADATTGLKRSEKFVLWKLDKICWTSWTKLRKSTLGLQELSPRCLLRRFYWSSMVKPLEYPSSGDLNEAVFYLRNSLLVELPLRCIHMILNKEILRETLGK